MKKLTMLLMFVLPMAMASHLAHAQEVTITLSPGWTWVSYPRADTLDVTTALQGIPPTDGDQIKSQDGFSMYMNGYWIGSLHQLIPGKGLMYQSMNPETVSFVFGAEPQEPNDDWVDLGLPSGLLWATRNVGANSPEDYGDYFAWAETSPKSNYDWNTYQYCCNSSGNSLTKYCGNSSSGCNGFTDDLTILQPGDDAATANYGGRTPTKEEWEELCNNCTNVLTTQNGVNGRLFTAPNGNSLFLPAAGYRYGSSLSNAGSRGYYWSSSLDTDYPNSAWVLYFYSSYCVTSSSGRDGGRSVRAVRSAFQN